MPKKQKTSSKKVKNKKKQVLHKKTMLVIMIVLALFLVVLSLILLVQFNFIKNPLEKISSEERIFAIKDECSLIVGQLIHTIKDGITCELKCKTNCNAFDMKFHDSKFIENTGDCHRCECTCK